MLRHVIALMALTLPALGQNLVVHYKLDESSGTLVSDSSGNGLHAQTMGVTSWVPGMFGGGLDLDGLSGHVAAPHDPLHDIAQLTIAAWVNVDVFQNWDGVLTKGTNQSPYSLMLGDPLGKFKFQANAHTPPNGVGGGIFTSSGDLTADQWHHLAVTFDGTEVRLYLDGVLDSVHPTPGVVLGNTTGQLTLGADFPGGDEYLDGTLDDVRLYDGALSATAIANLFDGSVGTPYCFGQTGSGNPCPCGNDNDGTTPLGGCQHDDSTAGARLDASGTASVTSDSLLLEGSRGPISNSTLFFQANNDLNGASVYLGDGIRCAGGGLIRLKVKSTDASGYADSSPAVITTRSSSFGHTISPGETLYYQWWIRDPAGSPCANENNTSNGYSITWST